MSNVSAIICHSPEDESLASVCCMALERAGIRCLAHRDNASTNESNTSSVIDPFDRCGVLIVLLSEHASNSREIIEQVQRAIKRVRQSSQFESAIMLRNPV
jgi:hypothetical protein